MRFLRTDKDDECAARFNTRASLKTQRAGTWKEKKNEKINKKIRNRNAIKRYRSG